MKRVLIVGPVLSHSGYGEHARFVLRALKSMPEEFDLFVRAIRWGETSWIWEDSEEREWIDQLIAKSVNLTDSSPAFFDISLQITVPQEWSKLARINIGVTAGTETTKISPRWLSHSLEMDRIIVVSEHSKSAFANTVHEFTNEYNVKTEVKLQKPVDVVGFPAKNIDATPIDLNLEHYFNFLMVGTWIPRKNIENTISWFIEEFQDQEVGLVIKTCLAKNSLRDRWHTAQRLRGLVASINPNAKCSIYLLHGDIPEAQMMGLYTHPKIKCLVNIAHGEGFGLPMFEAASVGLPIATVGWGGQLDYLTVSSPKSKKGAKKELLYSRISSDIAQIKDHQAWDDVLYKDSQWAYAKEWHYKKTLRGIVKEYGTKKKLAEKLQKRIISEFSESKQNQKLCEAVLQALPSSDLSEASEVLSI